MSEVETVDFYDRYQPQEVLGLPKYAQLRETLLAAINDGYWGPGSQLPNESTLAAITPFSLGTVQKALRELVQAKVIVRRHGHGTFVAERAMPMMSPMHLRFEDDAGQVLPIYAEVVGQETGLDGKDWADKLGSNVRNVVKVDRVFAVDELFHCFTHFYIDSDRFPAFAEAELLDFAGANFKALLFNRYHISIASLDQKLRCERFPDEVCQQLALEEGTVGAVLEFHAMGNNGRPLYYQEAFIPPNGYRLRLDANLEP
ncbi:GntR family transcriptional regulator [Pseudomonas sp. GD03860]|uniref:GntR family transcriptional regulator n=1 Tax=Pseudomonas TaxID=286 RepID=UPI0023647A31|nr:MULTISPECIES: GntR family transcriptional regulator [Pseudomonas]MDD2056654.1 GntR family transcriptional regulator [Pseudomonas putida]MDH0638152.1 GntR family transcriptional regulator [Pseudomonas sp. GD03860]